MKSLYEWCIENDSNIYNELSNENKCVSSDSISYGSNKKVWWICNLGHKYQTTPNHRTSGKTGCPFCANKKVLKGFNDVGTIYPNVILDWDYNKNKLSPSAVLPNSNKKYWFICSKGHSYDVEMYHKINGAGCPICSNKRILSGYNDLATTHPRIIDDWDFEKNDSNPNLVFAGSHRKVWWKCKEGHSYLSMIASRTFMGTGCPFCQKQKLIVGENDLQSVNPELAKEWDYDKNSYKPNEVFANSNKKAHWICSKGHSFYSYIYDRNNGKGCPICSNKKIIPGINDLATTHPILFTEWDFEKNKINPMSVSYGSDKKVWWKCNKGHEWEATISSRSKKDGNGCPICAQGLQSSLPEKLIAFYLKENFEILENVKLDILDKYELDIYIPHYKIGIEYDGDKWHSDIEKDKRKDDLCAKNGITLIRIREPYCPDYESSAILIKVNKPRNDMIYMGEAIKTIFDLIYKLTGVEIKTKVDIEKDYLDIISMKNGQKLKNSILFTSLFEEWNYEKNKNVNPAFFSKGSNKKVWWKCSKGHEWQAIINSRSKGNGCPYCSSNKILNGFNDLATQEPMLICEWNYDKNGTLKPNMVMKSSNKKVWWKCNKGHEWEAVISSRVAGNKCPICSNQKLLIGYNDLATTHPLLVNEWDKEKNYPLEPTMVMKGTDKKVWWKCDKGHEWQAYIYSRSKIGGSNCPICYKEKRRKKGI